MDFKPIFAVLMIVLAACFVVAQSDITEDDIISNSLIDKKAVASGMDDSLTSSDSRVSPNSKKIRSTGGSNTSTGSVVNSGGSGGSNNNNDDESNGRRLPPISLPLEDLSTDVSRDDEENSGFSAITGAVIGAVGKRGIFGIVGLLILVAVIGAFVYSKRRSPVKTDSK